jgi:hypothetical protein
MPKTLKTPYEKYVILWPQKQPRALRERDFSKLDIEHLADPGESGQVWVDALAPRAQLCQKGPSLRSAQL